MNDVNEQLSTMSMSKLSENYYLRNYYLETKQVPTQTVMRERMTLPLANVYFKSMTPKLKVLAGLEPPLKGAGSDWYMAPDDLLDGRAVLKPIKKQYLKKLGFNGVDLFGDQLIRDYHDILEEEKRRLLLRSDLEWKEIIEATCSSQWTEISKQQTKQNTANIQQAFHEFSIMYASSINSIESILFNAAIKEIKRVEEEAFTEMTDKYAEFLKLQATMLYDRWTSRLMKKKNWEKENCITTLENARTELGHKIHDINVEKHIAIERLRAQLECQNLACQVYVALKEREESTKRTEMSEHEHKKALRILSEKIQLQDLEIKLAKEKELSKQNFIKLWQKKVCNVVKRFQLFVKYCLHTLPEHADFFINMEKLMLLQISKAMDKPSAESIFVPEEPTSPAPAPKPHPFFLFCDKGYTPKLEEDQCTKHCTSSAPQFPVVVINKRYIYTACDNLEIFTEKVKQFLSGHRGDDMDLADDHDYKFDIPLRCTPSDQLKELKLESSLMQVLQKEVSNAESIKLQLTLSIYNKSTLKRKPEVSTHSETIKMRTNVRDFDEEIKSGDLEIEHQREPKWDSYINYIISKRCLCSKKAKKHLEEHLPVYMRNMSQYSEPELPKYKTCTIDKLKHLVKNTHASVSPPTSVNVESKTRNIGTQYVDQEFDFLCSCFSDEEVKKVFEGSRFYMHEAEQHFKVVDGSLPPEELQRRESSFVPDRARSLRRLIEVAPELEEIFKRNDCEF